MSSVRLLLHNFLEFDILKNFSECAVYAKEFLLSM